MRVLLLCSRSLNQPENLCIPFCEQSEHSWNVRVHRPLHSLVEDRQTSEQNSKPVQRGG